MPVLVTACKDGNVEIVRSLLKNYADVEAGDMVSEYKAIRYFEITL